MPEGPFRQFLELECSRALRSTYFFCLVVVRIETANINDPIRSKIIHHLRPALREFDIFGVRGGVLGGTPGGTLERGENFAVIMPY